MSEYDVIKDMFNLLGGLTDDGEDNASSEDSREEETDAETERCIHENVSLYREANAGTIY